MRVNQLRQMAKEKLPAVRAWIHETLDAHAREAKPVAALNFARLPHSFDSDLLGRAKVVLTEALPTIPFHKLGLSDFAAFGAMPAAAITYHDTYFVLRPRATEESLYVHELVHVIQWLELGMDGFLLAYASGLLTMGYVRSPLEVQARNHELRFNRREKPYPIREAVRKELATMAVGFPSMPPDA
jgi:hypothetical protein